MDMHHVRRGTGRPLLLLHGLGGSHRSWSTIAGALESARDVIAVDLPGFGETAPLPGELSIATLADAVTSFIGAQALGDVDMVGSSMGARLVLELARRGVGGRVVSLDPGGFWQGWEKTFFGTSIGASIQLVRALQPVMPAICRNPIARSVLLPQFSPKPWLLDGDAVLTEMRDYARARSFDPLLRSLVDGPEQQGIPAGAAKHAITIVWGRQDRVCLPRQAARACAKFPDARLVWFEQCGHFPHWDRPEETVRLILQATA